MNNYSLKTDFIFCKKEQVVTVNIYTRITWEREREREREREIFRNSPVSSFQYDGIVRAKRSDR